MRNDNTLSLEQLKNEIHCTFKLRKLGLCLPLDFRFYVEM